MALRKRRANSPSCSFDGAAGAVSPVRRSIPDRRSPTSSFSASDRVSIPDLLSRMIIVSPPRASVEGHAYPESRSPDYSAWELQVIFLHDQRERGRDSRAPIRKLQSSTRDREITNDAGCLVAPIVNLRRLRNAIPGGNPSFDHSV